MEPCGGDIPFTIIFPLVHDCSLVKAFLSEKCNLMRIAAGGLKKWGIN